MKKNVKAFRLFALLAAVILLSSSLAACQDEKYEIGQLISFTHSSSYDPERGELVVCVTASNVNKNVTVNEYSALVSLKVGVETVAEREYTGAAIAPGMSDESVFLFSESELGVPLAEASVSVFARSAAVDNADVLYDAYDTAPSLGEQWQRYFNMSGASCGISHASIAFLSASALLILTSVIFIVIGFSEHRTKRVKQSVILTLVALLISVACGVMDVDFSLIIAHLDFYDMLAAVLIIAIPILPFSCAYEMRRQHYAAALTYALTLVLSVIAFILLILNMLIALNLWASTAAAILAFIVCEIAAAVGSHS